MIYCLGYWNDFLVPTLFKCQVDLCCAVSCNYSYILGFCLFSMYKVWLLLGQLIWPSVISIYKLHLRFSLNKKTYSCRIGIYLKNLYTLFRTLRPFCWYFGFIISFLCFRRWSLTFWIHVSWEDQSSITIGKLASF